VVNADYLLLAKEWARRVSSVSGRQPVFICADRESLDHLQSLGFACLDYADPDSFRAGAYQSLAFPSEYAAYTSSLKFRPAQSFVRSGQDCIYSDVDALWLQDPFPHLQQSFSLACQAGSFPEVAKQRWGFSACAGFMALRAHENVETLVEKVIDLLDGSDQLALNQVMLDACSIEWQQHPVDWEHCAVEHGWIAPIAGRCMLSGLDFLALPHVYFQRHNVAREHLEHAAVCHPNSP
jgi:hypothetical protein